MAQPEPTQIFATFAVAMLVSSIMNFSQMGFTGLFSVCVMLYFVSVFLGGFFGPITRRKK